MRALLILIGTLTCVAGNVGTRRQALDEIQKKTSHYMVRHQQAVAQALDLNTQHRQIQRLDLNQQHGRALAGNAL